MSEPEEGGGGWRGGEEDMPEDKDGTSRSAVGDEVHCEGRATVLPPTHFKRISELLQGREWGCGCIAGGICSGEDEEDEEGDFFDEGEGAVINAGSSRAQHPNADKERAILKMIP